MVRQAETFELFGGIKADSTVQDSITDHEARMKPRARKRIITCQEGPAQVTQIYRGAVKEESRLCGREKGSVAKE